MKKPYCLLLALSLLVSTLTQSSNLIVNDHFGDNKCRSGWCIGGNPDLVPGWTPDPFIEIGWASFYSDYLNGETRVVELAPEIDACIYQVIKNVQPGNYELTIEYAPKKDKAFEDSVFNVSINGELLKQIKASAYQLQTQVITFSVYNPFDAKLRFCSVGGPNFNNGEGAVLKSVSLIMVSSNQQNNGIAPASAQNQAQSSGLLEPINPSQNQPQAQNQQYQQQQIQQQQPQKQPIQNGMSLNSHAGKCFQKDYQTQGGLLMIAFDYKVNSQSQIKDSSTVVTIDGKPIYKVSASDNGSNVKLQGQLDAGQHYLGFCPLGSDKEQPHEVVIYNIAISEKVCTGEWSEDLILNGGFDKNTCKTNNCISNEKTKPEPVANWIPSPEIKMVKVSATSPTIGGTWTAELAGNKNTCIKQNIANLKQGKAEVSFSYTARKGTTIKGKGFDLKVNGNLVKSYKVIDFKGYNETFEFNVDNVPSSGSVIEFCGTGPNNNVGILVNAIKLRSFDQCVKSQVVQY